MLLLFEQWWSSCCAVRRHGTSNDREWCHCYCPMYGGDGAAVAVAAVDSFQTVLTPPPSLPPSPPGQFCCWRQNEYRLVSSSGMAALLCCRSRWDYYYYPEALTVCVANRVDRTAVATAAVLRSCTPIYHLYVCLPVSICDESRSSPFSCCYHVLSLVLMLLLQQHSPVSAKRVNCPR